MINKQRCFNCNKKLGLLPYDCKCGNLFCIKCRYPEIHKCNYDFKNKDNLKKKSY